MYKLRVCSIFTSIDGEVNGFHGMGEVSTFIRLQGCNLKCVGCDTEYSQFMVASSRLLTCEEVVEEVTTQSVGRKVTITGGEPFLQLATIDLIRLLYGRQFLVTVETNGTICPEGIERPHACGRLRIVADYKCPSSGISSSRMAQDLFDILREDDVVKFVVEDEDDLSFVRYKLNGGLKDCDAYFAISPKQKKGGSFEECLRWSRRVAEFVVGLCSENCYSIGFSFQLHRLLWPEATGPENEK